MLVSDGRIEGIPPLTEEEIREGSRCLKNYIFVQNEKTGKICYCTACGERFYLTFPCRIFSGADWDLYSAKHRTRAACPKCGKESTVINRGKKKNLADLRDQDAVIFVKPVSENEVWIRGEYFYRIFGDSSVEDVRESYEVYRFVKDEGCAYWRALYWNNDFVKYKTVRDPFGHHNMSYLGFVWDPCRWVGLDRLKETFLRYSRFDPDAENRYYNTMSYLETFSRYPRIIEMLEKRGFDDLVECKVLGRKTRNVCRWNAKDYRKFWRLSTEEVKALAAYRGDPEIADVYKRFFTNFGPQDGMKAAQWWMVNISLEEKEVDGLLRKYGRTIKEFWKYGRKHEEMKGWLWKDYVHAAEAIGYDLTVHNVIFPRDLRQAHDEAVKTRRIKTEEREIKKSMERVAALEKQYGYTDGVYLIRPPKDTKEIVDEGNALRHCVGDYAARHAEGETTILFMRAAKAPDKPLYTIEMHGKTLRQAHGYKNRENPEDVPKAKAFLDAWLKWVKAGSKRDKNGAPKVISAEKQVKNDAGKTATGKKKGKAA